MSPDTNIILLAIVAAMFMPPIHKDTPVWASILASLFTYAVMRIVYLTL